MRIKRIKNKACLLTIFENLKIRNFEVKRVFFLKASKNCIRGNHAHKECTQVFLSLKGNIDIMIGKKNLKKKKLKEFSNFIKVSPLNWVKIKLNKNQILMVLCDKKFSERDYIRNYDSFIKIIK